MPYRWTQPDTPDGTAELTLWPHRSLTAEGFVAFFGATALLVSIPLLALVGSAALWILLPFVALGIAGAWYALRRNNRDLDITETLYLSADTLRVERRQRGRATQHWQANPYWVSVQSYADAGPVEHYLTLKGEGREIELGRFLSPEERQSLRGELQEALAGLSPGLSRS